MSTRPQAILPRDVVKKLAELVDVLRRPESILAAASVSVATVAEFTTQLDREMARETHEVAGTGIVRRAVTNTSHNEEVVFIQEWIYNTPYMETR